MDKNLKANSTKDTVTNDSIRRAVQQQYAKVATHVHEPDNDAVQDTTGAGCGTLCCSTQEKADVACGSGDPSTEPVSMQALGYSETDALSIPEGANLGLGCGNPQAIAALKPEEAVLDLGSGAGIDCFLAAQQVGEQGLVIGVDMTAEMISKARANADRAGYHNVVFRLGEIEHLPVADQSIDVIISNCVINLSPDKPQVFADAFRVLKPGGRIAVSDVVALTPIAEELQADLALYTGCVSGASTVDEIKQWLQASGFSDIRITAKGSGEDIIKQWMPDSDLNQQVISANIEATKPLI